MKPRILLLVAVTVALIASLSIAPLAAKPDNHGKPTTTATTTGPDATTVPDDGLNTCLDVGSAWNLGEWQPNQNTYTAETLPICVDLNADIAHKDWTHWKVTWSGTSTRATRHGAAANLIFEEQLHENSYASNEIALGTRTTSGYGTWNAHLDFAGTEPGSLVLVAMPHSGAKWSSFTITVEPVSP